jgi:glycosyltransferase involved in cell wall biosynthesis
VTGRPLRILVINWQDRENPQAGGAEVHLHETFKRMAAAGHDVTFLVSGWPGARTRLDLDGVEIHRTGGRYTFSVACPLYYRRHLRDRAFDVVVEDLNKVPVFAPLWAGVPVVLLVHHLFGRTAFKEASLPVAAGTWLLERPVPRVFSRVSTIAVSDSTREDLIARGMPGDSISVIPNGIELSQYSPGPWHERTEEPTLLYLGRLKRYKGVDLILQAVARLREMNVACRLRVAGTGDYREDLEALASELDLGDRVEFLGFVSPEEKLKLFRESWIHVLTSPKEGWGISNIEAAACGTPTIASDSPGLRDSVQDGTTGFLVPHGDLGGLVEALKRLIGDEALRSRLGGEAVAFAQNFSWDSTSRRVLALLEAAANGSLDRMEYPA